MSVVYVTTVLSSEVLLLSPTKRGSIIAKEGPQSSEPMGSRAISGLTNQQTESTCMCKRDRFNEPYPQDKTNNRLPTSISEASQ